MFKGMYPNCNFAIHHNSFDHIKLAEMLKKHKGGFLMTYNNCSTIRDLYNDCKFDCHFSCVPNKLMSSYRYCAQANQVDTMTVE
jgi:site-specific DNA-adenine methylase